MQLPFFKNEKDGKDYEGKADEVVPFELFFQVQDGKYAEYDECDYFLNCFQLSCIVDFMPDTVCGNLKAIFKKRNPPAYEDNHN